MTCKAKNIYSLSDPSRKSQQALEPRWQLINGQTLEPRKNNEVWGMEPCTPKWWHRKSGVTGTNVTTHLKQLRTKYKKTPVVQTMDIKQWRTMISGQKTRVNLTTWGIFPGCRAGRGTPSAQKTLGAEWMQLKTGKPRQVVLIGQCSGEHTRRKSCTDKTPEMYRGTPGAVSRVLISAGWEETTSGLGKNHPTGLEGTNQRSSAGPRTVPILEPDWKNSWFVGHWDKYPEESCLVSGGKWSPD